MVGINVLKKYCLEFVPFTKEELDLTDRFFEYHRYKRKDLVLQEGKICDFIAFIASGVIRHFHTMDGNEITCDISVENTFITDFSSLNNGTPSKYNFQALHESELFVLKKDKLQALYATCSRYETLGRLMAERNVQRSAEIARSLASDKPEARYLNLIKEHPDLFQRVPQKYIANFLGVSPESLSRIRKRVSERKT